MKVTFDLSLDTYCDFLILSELIGKNPRRSLPIAIHALVLVLCDAHDMNIETLKHKYRKVAETTFLRWQEIHGPTSLADLGLLHNILMQGG